MQNNIRSSFCLLSGRLSFEVLHYKPLWDQNLSTALLRRQRTYCLPTFSDSLNLFLLYFYQMSIRVFIYEDNEIHRDSLRALINLSAELEWVGDAPDCSHVLDDIQQHYPDVVLMDINMPLVNGLEGLRQIKSMHPSVKVLMQTAFEDADKIFTSLRNGANGYILKKDSVARLSQAIMEVYDGGAAMNPGIASKVLAFFKPKALENNLSQRENDVLVLLAKGHSYKMIAEVLHISYSTVNSHIKNIYIKLHISSLGEAIAYYYRHVAQL